MAQFVDWDLAAATAGALGKNGPRVSLSEATEIVAQLRLLADEAAEHVSAYTGLQPVGTPAPVRVVDRRDWVDANVAGMREVISPLISQLSEKEPSALTEMIGSRATGLQTGTVLAFLSGRVLGQFDVLANDPGQLLLVAPNIVDVERRLEADPRDFRLWVCLHEVTHRVQFTAVPWMRGYFLGEVQAFVDASQADDDRFLERLRRAVGMLASSARDPQARTSVLDLVQTPGQKAVLDRLTALMTLLEGHAEFVMDGVGPEVVPSVEQIRARFNQRREPTSPVEKAFRRLIGIDAKMRQYAEGRAFVHGVVERVGMAGFNKVFSSPLTLPKIGELADPDAWVARVHGRTAPAADAG